MLLVSFLHMVGKLSLDLVPDGVELTHLTQHRTHVSSATQSTYLTKDKSLNIHRKTEKIFFYKFALVSYSTLGCEQPLSP